jgi:hypothetical protein
LEPHCLDPNAKDMPGLSPCRTGSDVFENQ